MEGLLWDLLKQRFPNLTNVYVPPSGTGRYHAYLQLKDPSPGEARQAILAVLSAKDSFYKHVFCFDDDVDIFSPREVMWAIATRTQWDRDVIIIPRTNNTALDPSLVPGVVGTVGGIDCTKPWGEPYEVRVRVDPEVLQRIKLEDFVSLDALARVNTERV